jgi:biotin transport system substrate-specific component
MSVSAKETVIAASKSVAKPRAVLWRVTAILGFMGLIAIGAHAKVAVPWTPVPITLQTFFVLLAGALLGPVDGVAAVAGYIIMGVFGVPIFAKAGGPVGLSYLSGVTGGYLVGFLAAAAFLGIAARRTEKRVLQLVLFFAASQMILWPGTLWLKFALAVTLPKAVLLGYAPFVIGDLLKTSAACGIYRWLRRRQDGGRL